MVRDYSQMKYQVLPDTHPVLKLRAEEVTVFDHDLKNVINRMIFTMDMDGGCGLAAPQIGKSIRVLVMRPGVGPNPRPNEKPWHHKTAIMMINPVIIEKGILMEKGAEGCLSSKGRCFIVDRPDYVKVKCKDIGEKDQYYHFEGWQARVFLHEYDHLEGILISDIGDEVIRDSSK